MLSRPRLAWLLATHRRGWAAALGLCLAAAVALPALLLLVDAMAAESGLAQALNQAGGLTVGQTVAGVDAFDALDRQVDGRVTARTGAALVPLASSAAVGSLHVQTALGEPAPASLTGQALSAVYTSHLAEHVSVVAGELPPEGLGGGETAVSLPRAAADRLGLHLSDRVCGDFSGTRGAATRWCVRIVGLWTPLAAGDPYWGGAAPRPELTMGRYDLFELARQAPQPPDAAIRYWASPDAVALEDATALATSVRALDADLRAPGRRVDSQVDETLIAFAGRQRAVSTAIRAMAALAAVLGLEAVALVSGRLLDGRRRELALLRARGWPGGRVWLLAFGGLGAIGATASAAAIAACLLAAAALTAAGSGLSALALRRTDVPGMAAALAAVASAVIVLLAAQAARALGGDRARPGPLGAGLGFLPPALLVPGRGTVPGALARLQLSRRRGQHAGAAFVLLLATAGAVFAALGLAADRAGPPQAQVALDLGLDVALGAGALGGLLVGLVVYGLHFASAARRRVREYGGLFAHGLPPEEVARSVAAEQAATARASLLSGCALGVAMALAVAPAPPLAPAAAAAAAALLGLGLAVLLIGTAARRLPARVDPFLLRRQA